MDGDILVELIVPTVAIICATILALRLIAPFAVALAERLRPKLPATDDALRGELRSLGWRVEALEREHAPPALPRSSVTEPHQEPS
jgi:hypothetical protein